MYALILVAYWVLFWRRHLCNPYLLCTSEVASTFFPHWIWMGRELRAGRFPAQDDIFYKLPGSIPFLSTFYPPSLLVSWLVCHWPLDRSFRAYTLLILGHFLVGSLGAYWMFSQVTGPEGALFGALTMTYAGYMIKPNTPCFVFSACWVPLALSGGWLGAIAWGLALMGGYFPILVYVMPVVAIMAPLSFLGGCFLAMPQLLPFLGYFKRSVRMHGKDDPNFGKVPLIRLLDLINPIRFQGTVNGVHYPEVMMYMGIAPFLIWQWSWWWIPLTIASLLLVGLLPSIQRIPARILFLLSLCVTYLSVQSEMSKGWTLILFQSWLLLKNSSIYPSFPFNQWWNKPSRLYTQRPKSYNWPYVTGYLEGVKRSDYAGAFRLAN